MIKPNIFPAACSTCDRHVAKYKGTREKIGKQWVIRCAACSPVTVDASAPIDTPARAADAPKVSQDAIAAARQFLVVTARDPLSRESIAIREVVACVLYCAHLDPNGPAEREREPLAPAAVGIAIDDVMPGILPAAADDGAPYSPAKLAALGWPIPAPAPVAAPAAAPSRPTAAIEQIREAAWRQADTWRDMAATPVERLDVARFLAAVYQRPIREIIGDAPRADGGGARPIRALAPVASAFMTGGRGPTEAASGTVWGLYQAVTEYFSHGAKGSKRDADSRLDSVAFGDAAHRIARADLVAEILTRRSSGFTWEDLIGTSTQDLGRAAAELRAA